MAALFVDTCFLIGLNDRDDQYNKKAMMIWDKLIKIKIIKGLEDVIISEYVLVEVFQGLQNHAGFKVANRVYDELVENCKIQHVTESMVKAAINQKLAPYLNHKTNQPPIGLVDAISLVTMDKLRISWILSFDAGFDHIPLIKRISDESSLPFNRSVI